MTESRLKNSVNSNFPVAYMNLADVSHFPDYEPSLESNSLFIFVRTYAQFVVRVKVDDAVPEGSSKLNSIAARKEKVLTLAH